MSLTYGANSLNEYTNRTVPNAADVIGIADAQATVTVNGTSTSRRAEYYQTALSIDNGATNMWQVVSNYATLTGTNQTNVGYIFLPKTPESFGFDPDGNQTNDGRWSFTWDAENRLASMVCSNVADGAKRELTMAYDSRGRRVQKTAFTWVSRAWQTNTENYFHFRKSRYAMMSALECGIWNILSDTIPHGRRSPVWVVFIN